jgi:hypothetical protein
VTLIAYPREEPDLDQFVQALMAMAVDQLTIKKRQAAVLRGEIKLLPPGSDK